MLAVSISDHRRGPLPSWGNRCMLTNMVSYMVFSAPWVPEEAWEWTR